MGANAAVYTVNPVPSTHDSPTSNLRSGCPPAVCPVLTFHHLSFISDSCTQLVGVFITSPAYSVDTWCGSLTLMSHSAWCSRGSHLVLPKHVMIPFSFGSLLRAADNAAPKAMNDAKRPDIHTSTAAV